MGLKPTTYTLRVRRATHCATLPLKMMMIEILLHYFQAVCSMRVIYRGHYVVVWSTRQINYLYQLVTISTTPI